MRRLLALPLAALAIVMACSAAAAGTPPRITQARAPFPQRAFILGLPAAMRLSPGQVRVLENGKPVSGVHVEAAGGSAEQFGVVLLIDASNSMRGEAIDGAMAAARAFASKRTKLEQLAVVAFNDKSQVVLPFTTDPEAIDSALQETPHLAYGTHIYDGVETSLRLIAHAKIRAASIVVLSDGADTGSHATEAVAAAAANREHVRVFTVGLRSAGFDPAKLQQLAADGGGQYSLASSPAQLREIYSALGAKFAREYVVTYHSSVGPGRRVGVAVQVKGLPSVASSG
jgi:uncharacterized protein YegL